MDEQIGWQSWLGETLELRFALRARSVPPNPRTRRACSANFFRFFFPREAMLCNHHKRTICMLRKESSDGTKSRKETIVAEGRGGSWKNWCGVKLARAGTGKLFWWKRVPVENGAQVTERCWSWRLGALWLPHHLRVVSRWQSLRTHGMFSVNLPFVIVCVSFFLVKFLEVLCFLDPCWRVLEGLFRSLPLLVSSPAYCLRWQWRHSSLGTHGVGHVGVS
jgi:hypothetical protein